MKSKFYTLLSLLFIGISIYAEEYEALKVVLFDGQEKVHALSLIGRIEFTNDSLSLVNNEGQILGREHKDNVRIVSFGTESSAMAVSTLEINQNILIYPNPVQQTLVVKGAKVDETIRIYSLQGGLISTAKVYDENTTIDVHDLPNGQYILQINTHIVKLIKQ